MGAINNIDYSKYIKSENDQNSQTNKKEDK